MQLGCVYVCHFSEGPFNRIYQNTDLTIQDRAALKAQCHSAAPRWCNP